MNGVADQRASRTPPVETRQLTVQSMGLHHPRPPAIENRFPCNPGIGPAIYHSTISTAGWDNNTIIVIITNIIFVYIK